MERNIDIEAALLGSVITASDIGSEAAWGLVRKFTANGMTEGWFESGGMARLFAAMLAATNAATPIDPVTLAQAVGDYGAPIVQAAIDAAPPTSAYAEGYLVAMRDREVCKRAKAVMERAIRTMEPQNVAAALGEVQVAFGSMVRTITGGLSDTRAPSPTDAPRRLIDIPYPQPEEQNPDALFRNGWGRRGHFSLLVAPSGVGKSVISLQAAYAWALGRQGLIGSEPIRPLSVGIIQAEDDDTEMGEFRRNHDQGFAAEGWSAEDIERAGANVVDFSPQFVGCTGEEFCIRLSVALEHHPVDVVVINPLQSFAGIEIAKNAELTKFLRADLDPVIKRRRTFVLCVHHTNKPPGAKERTEWGVDGMAAYVGAGGAELVNYARSVTVIVPDKALGSEGYYWIRGAKRGNRLGWRDDAGNKTIQRCIAYSADCIHWRCPDAAELTEKGLGGKPKAGDAEKDADATTTDCAHTLAALIRKEGRPLSATEVRAIAQKSLLHSQRREAVAMVFARPADFGLQGREAYTTRGKRFLQLCAFGADVVDELDKLEI